MTNDLMKLMAYIDSLQSEPTPAPIIEEVEETKVHPLLQAMQELKEEGIVEAKESIKDQIEKAYLQDGGNIDDYFVRSSYVDKLGFSPKQVFARSPDLDHPDYDINYIGQGKGSPALWFYPLNYYLKSNDVYTTGYPYVWLVKLKPNAWLQPVDRFTKSKKEAPQGKDRVGILRKASTPSAIFFKPAFDVVDKFYDYGSKHKRHGEVKGPQVREENTIDEYVNKDTVTPGFKKEKWIMGGKYKLVATAKDRRSDEDSEGLIIQVIDPTDDSSIRQGEVGSARLVVKGDGTYDDKALVSSLVRVRDEHRRKGLASAMYQFARELGNEIAPSFSQTELGKAFWQGGAGAGREFPEELPPEPEAKPEEKKPFWKRLFKEDDLDEEIAYHGTTDDINEFRPLTHFGTEKAAKDRMTYKKIKDGKIYKVDLDIKNPLTIKDFPGTHYDRLYAFELKDKRLISQEEMEDITFTQDKDELRQKLLKKLNELGIDGFVYKNKYEDKGNISYVIVDPSQVKVLSVEPATEAVAEEYTFDQKRRQLNIPELIKRGAFYITHPHGPDGWETDRPDWDFSLITLQNILQKSPSWSTEYKKYIRPESYSKATPEFFNKLSDQKYNQILWSINKLGIPDDVAFLDKLDEAKNAKFVYHVTPTQNLRSVMKNGLVPNIGDRSSKIAGEQSGIYLFPSVEAAEDAVMNWLGDEFDEDEPLTLLKVNIDGLEKYIRQGADYELIVNTAIEPNRIHKLDTQLEEASPDTLEGSFTPDLVESKTWLAKMLAKGLKGKNAGTIYVLGSWYGNMGIFLQQAGVKFKKLVLVEPDEEALMRSKDLLQQLGNEGKLILIHQNAEDVVYEKPGVVINTSCNETGPVFLTKLPDNMLCLLQARNNVDDVLFETDSLDEFVEYYPLGKTYYTGEKELIDPETEYTRYMIIGRTGSKIDETVSTGQGGGSAGSSGGQMVGGPTTYEEEYGMFKSKGPRRITAMTNEALDSSYPYEEYSAGKYHFVTDTGVKYKVYLQGKDMVEVAFSAILPGEEENFRPDKTTLTGTGDSRKVFGTVVKIVKEYLDTHKPNALYFTAENSEPSRIKLYNRLIAQVDKELPDYKALGNVDLGSGTAYMLKRKNAEINEALDSSYPYEFKNDAYYFNTEAGNDYKVFFNGTDKVEVAFVTRDKSGQIKDTITGTGDSRKVFGTVINIVKDYVSKHKPNILLFAADSNAPSRVKLYSVLAAKASKELPGYNLAKTLKNKMFTVFYLTKDNVNVPKMDTAKNTLHKTLDKVFENNIKTVTLFNLYDGAMPDHDERIWNYVGDSDFDIPFEVHTIQPFVLDQILCDQYGVDDVEDLFYKMQPDQEEIIRDYQEDPNLSNQIIVLHGGNQILDGNHRALAAVLANKSIKYIDVGEEDESS